MSLSIDHVFVCTSDPARVLPLLRMAGLTAGAHRTHSGQGTENACCYFENAYLEVLWPRHEGELRSAAVQPLGLWDRIYWRETGACPFGIALRGDELPDPAWRYAAPFLPPGESIAIVTPERALEEPVVFHSLGATPPAAQPTSFRHERRLTSVSLDLTIPTRLPRIAAFTTRTAPAYGMHLEFEGGRDLLDFGPLLPLTIRW